MAGEISRPMLDLKAIGTLLHMATEDTSLQPDCSWFASHHRALALAPSRQNAFWCIRNGAVVMLSDFQQAWKMRAADFGQPTEMAMKNIQGPAIFSA